MRRSLFRKTAAFGLSLALIGTLLAYADSVGNPNPATLSADGQLTPRTRAILSGDYAYLLGQSEIVAPDIKLDRLAPSPAGDAALIAGYKSRPFRAIALATDKPGKTDASTSEFNLIYWDARTRVSKTLFREAVREDALVGIAQIEWLPQTRTALIVLNRVTLADGHPGLFSQSLLRVDAAAGTMSRITDLGQGRAGDSDVATSSVEISPSLPLAFIRTVNSTGRKVGPLVHSVLRVYTPQGLRAPIALPDGVAGLDWMPDGKSIRYDSIIERDESGTTTVRKQATLVNLETGEVTQPDKMPVIPKSNRVKEKPNSGEVWEIAVATANIALQTPEGKAQPTSALWLQAKAAPKKAAAVPAEGPLWADSVLIATNAEVKAQLATESAGAILFTRDGSLCAAPIFRLSAAAFEQALRGVQRRAAISNAKQVGLAIMGYAQDYDETFPVPGSGVQDAVGPYVKNPSVFENPGTGSPGFTFSYSGTPSLSGVAEPATTQLGYVSGPGGRAVIWADGHVTWQDG